MEVTYVDIQNKQLTIIIDKQDIKDILDNEIGGEFLNQLKAYEIIFKIRGP